MAIRRSGTDSVDGEMGNRYSAGRVVGKEALVKKCPYCAEDIQDEAVRCPYCRSDLTVDPEVAMGPPPGSPELTAPAQPEPEAGSRVGEGALRFSHSGERYVLGYGSDFFGIWDRHVPGGPVVRFPRTDQGWNEAWNRFSGMEARFVEVPHQGQPPPDVRVSTGAYRPIAVLGGWLVGLLAASGVFAGITAILRGVEIGRLHDFQAGATSLQRVDDARVAANGMAVFTLLVIVATAVVWLVWHFRGQSNLRSLGAADLRFTPGWAVAWWLIPFANIVMPFRTTAELWKASDPAAGAVEWKARRLPAVFVGWWTFWLARIPFVSLASAAAPRLNPSIDQLVRQRWFGIGSDLATIAAAAMAVVIVRQVTARQERKRSRVAAYGATVAGAATVAEAG